jgi:hypothetical protein
MGVTVASPTLQEECKLRVLENRVLWNIFKPKLEEVTGDCRKLHNKYHYMYSSPYQGMVGSRM